MTEKTRFVSVQESVQNMLEGFNEDEIVTFEDLEFKIEALCEWWLDQGFQHGLKAKIQKV